MERAHHDIIYQTEREHWWYRARRKIVHALITQYAPLTPSILDVGCGTGALLCELGRYGDARGIDVSEDALRYCRSRGIENVAPGSATAIPFPSNSVDMVLALDVIEHVQDDGAALGELNRVLKPGGVAIIFVPAFMFLWGVTDERSHHFRRYTRRELVTKVRAADFTIERSSYFNSLLFPPIAFLRLGVRALGAKLRSENELTPGFINRVLYAIFACEERLLRSVDFPFGVSILAVCRKPITP